MAYVSITEDIAKIYIKDVRRKPSIQEIETMLDMILGGNPESYLNDECFGKRA